MKKKSYICKCKSDLIENFKQTQDYIDICYMIDHVEDNEIRTDILIKLGYQVVSTITQKFHKAKHISIGRNNEIIIQIIDKIEIVDLVRNIIIRK